VTPTVKQLEDALAMCENGYDEPYPTVRYALQRELTRRRIAGRKPEYVGDAKERNKQAVKKYRDRKKFEKTVERHKKQKRQEEAERRDRMNGKSSIFMAHKAKLGKER
jgi:hypothetical protein